MQNTLQKGLETYYPLHEASGDGQEALGRGDISGTSPGAADGRVIGARDFEAGSLQFLRRPNGVADSWTSFGDEYFTFQAWVNKESSGAASQTILSKGAEANNAREYTLKWNTTSNRFEFIVGNAGLGIQTSVLANTFGAPANAAWHHLLAGYEPTEDIIFIIVNGILDTAARVDAVSAQAGATEFCVGVIDSGGLQQYWDGLMCEVAAWRRGFNRAERSWLYNDGRGRTYPFDGRPSPILVPQRYPRRGVYRVPGPVAPLLAT